MSANNASYFQKVINAQEYWVGKHKLSAADIQNSSSITGTTVEDALENLSGGGSGPLLTLNGAVGATQTFSTANAGTDFTVVTNTSTLDHQFRLPDANNLTARGVVSTGAQTFGGVKTFSSAPSLSTNTLTANGNLMTFPSSAQTLVGLSSSDILTNKTATSNTNNITATGLFTSGGTVNVSASSPPIANYVLMATGANAATWQPVSAAGSGILSINGLTDTAQAITTGTSGNDFNVATSGTATTVLNLPDASPTKRGVVTTGTQSFTGAKTFTTDATTFSIAPVLTTGTLTAGANLQTFPSSAQTLIGRTSTDTVTNKSLVDASTYIIDDSVSNKIAQFDCSLLTAGFTKTFQFPDANCVIVGDTNTQIVTNKTLQSTTATDSANVIYARALVCDSGTGQVSTYAAAAPSANQFLVATGSGTATWQSISTAGLAITQINSQAQTTQTLQVDAAGTNFAVGSSAGVHTFSLPNAGIGITRGAVTNSSQTIDGVKTFNASPVLGTGQLTVGAATVTVQAATDTLVALATTDALTNKTMTSATNNVTAKGLFVNGGTTVTVNATGGAPSANYVLLATSATNANWASLATNGVAVTSINSSTNTAHTIAVGSTNDGSNNFNITTSGSTHTINLCDASATVRGAVTTGAQTFAGVKTFSNVISTGSQTTMTVNGNTITFPGSNATLASLAGTETLTNKSLVDASTYIIDDSSPTKIAQFQCSALSAGATKTFTFPDVSMTFAGQDNIQTLTNKTLEDATTSIVDAGATSRVAKFECSSISNSTTRTFTFPDANVVLVGDTNTQTLTNKTLTTATITDAASSVSARALWYGSGSNTISTYASGTPSNGMVLTATGATTATWQTPSTSSGIGTSVKDANFDQTASLTTSSSTTAIVSTFTLSSNTVYYMIAGGSFDSQSLGTAQFNTVIGSNTTETAEVFCNGTQTALAAAGNIIVGASSNSGDPAYLLIHALIYCKVGGTFNLKYGRSGGTDNVVITSSKIKVWSL